MSFANLQETLPNNNSLSIPLLWTDHPITTIDNPNNNNHMTVQTNTTNIVLVGCGQIVTHHCAALAAAGSDSDSSGGGNNIKVVALCDPSVDRRTVIRNICHEHNLVDESLWQEFNTLEDLVKDQTLLLDKVVDVLFIAVPHDLHVTIATQALNTGKHVVMEKPLAPTLSECRTLQSIAATSQGLFIIAEQSPYWQEIVKAQELLSQGKIGTVVSAASYYYESMRDNVTSGTDASGGLGWRTSLKRCGGGIVMDGGLHWIRPLRVLCGEVERVVGVTQNAEPGLQLEGETLAHALFQIQPHHDDQNTTTTTTTTTTTPPHGGKPPTKSSLIATYSANMMHTAPMAHDGCAYFRITGTQGELVVAGTGLCSNGGGGLKLYNDTYPTGQNLFPPDRQGGFFLGFEGLWRQVLRMVERNDREAAFQSVRDAAADVAVVLALYKSANTGQWETCESL